MLPGKIIGCLSLACLLSGMLAREGRAQEETFKELQQLDWKESFYDPGTADWREKWLLDGEKARVFNTPQGMEFYAGPVPAEDTSHAVMWTRKSFSGPVKIEYEYTRLDAATKYVNILYIQATGSGEGAFGEEIFDWADLRKIPAMRMYYNHMNTYHISYAAYGNTDEPDKPDYIRARRYMPESGNGLRGTDLAPDYFESGLFQPGVKHKITVIKHGNDLYMEIIGPNRKMLCHWKNSHLPPVEEGRIGLRHMASRNARYRNFRVSETADLEGIRKELSGWAFAYDPVRGIGHEPGCTRRDPSDVIRAGDIWYVWYTKVYGRSPGYWGTVWYATSTDEGYSWKEEGEALGVGTQGSFDAQATFTPNILHAGGKYYLYYTGVKPTPGRTDGVFENNSTNDITAIGVAESDSPDGPFRRLHGGRPALEVSPRKDAFDSYRIDDAVLLVRNGKYWLYYKGRNLQHGPEGPGKTRMGVAFAECPEGPFRRYENNPILDRSHEVMIWKQGPGVACLASLSSTLEYAHDGLDFTSAALNLRIPDRERPLAPGAYRPDLVDPEAGNSGLSWGISMVHNGDEAYLVRWEIVNREQ
jgi:hypothetical protein